MSREKQIEEMTSKELHKTKIVPMRQELNRLEQEYYKLYRKELAEQNGLQRADCSNCAFSCVLSIGEHNQCLADRCTCCNTFCYSWTPETKVSAYLRERHKYDDDLIYRLKDIFGRDLLKHNDIELVLKAIRLMDEIEQGSKMKGGE